MRSAIRVAIAALAVACTTGRAAQHAAPSVSNDARPGPSSSASDVDVSVTEPFSPGSSFQEPPLYDPALVRWGVTAKGTLAGAGSLRWFALEFPGESAALVIVDDALHP